MEPKSTKHSAAEKQRRHRERRKLNPMKDGENKKQDSEQSILEPGSWCSFLIPACLLVGAYQYHGSCTFPELVVIGFGLAVQSLCLKFSTVGLNLFCVSVSFTLWTTTSYHIYLCFALGVYSMHTFRGIFNVVNNSFSSSFNFGEAAIVTQAITLLITTCYLRFLKYGMNYSNPCDLLVRDSSNFLQVLLFGCFLLVFIPVVVPRTRSADFFFLAFLSIAGFTYFIWMKVLGKDPIFWLWHFSFGSRERVVLITYWFLLSCVSIGFVAVKNQSVFRESSTVTRKFFHVVMVLIYLPGVIWDPELLYVASGCAFSIFLFLEVVRVLKIPPIGPIIHEAFQMFLDEKDSGMLILTHIYLLVGCSCPLWLYPKHFSKGFHISLLSGVISVGVGDTAASVGGSKWGETTWSGSKKTTEGTKCAIISQLVFILPLLLIGHAYSLKNLFLTLLAAVLTSLLEAKTTQIDNLVLPFFQYCILSLID